MPLAVRDNRVYVALGSILYVLNLEGEVLTQISLKDPKFPDQTVVINQLILTEQDLYAVEPNTDQVLIFDRQTLTRKPALRFRQSFSQITEFANRIYIPFPNSGIVTVIEAGKARSITVGGTPIQAIGE